MIAVRMPVIITATRALKEILRTDSLGKKKKKKNPTIAKLDILLPALLTKWGHKLCGSYPHWSALSCKADSGCVFSNGS